MCGGCEWWREMCDVVTNASFPQVSILIREQLIERAKDFNIILDDVSIVSGQGYQPAANLVVGGICICLHSIPD